MKDDLGIGNGFKIPIIVGIVVILVMVTAVLPGINFGINGGNNWNVTSAASYLNSAGYSVFATGGLSAGGVPVAQVDGTLATDSGFTYNSTIDTLTTSNISAPTGRTATYVIAASDATAQEKAQANVVLNGTSSLSGTIANGTGSLSSSPQTLNQTIPSSAYTITVAGTFKINIASGQTARAYSGTAYVVNSPVLITGGTEAIIEVIGTGTIFVSGMGDEVQINNALTALYNDPSWTSYEGNILGDVYFASGEAKIMGPITVWGGTTFRGTGINSTYLSLYSDCNMFEWADPVQNNFFLKWQDLMLDGNHHKGRAINAPSVSGKYLSDCRINDCFIENFSDWGLYLGTGWGWILNGTLIEHCRGGAIYCGGTDLTIENCKISGCRATTNDFACYFNVEGLMLSNSQFESNGRGAIWLYNSYNSLIANCQINGNSEDLPGVYSGIVLENSYGTAITNCNFNGYNGQKLANSQRHGIKVFYSDLTKAKIKINSCNFVNNIAEPVSDCVGGCILTSDNTGFITEDIGQAYIPSDSASDNVTVTTDLTVYPFLKKNYPRTNDLTSYNTFLVNGTGKATGCTRTLKNQNIIRVLSSGTVAVTCGSGVQGQAISNGALVTGGPVNLPASTTTTITLTKSAGIYDFYIYLAGDGVATIENGTGIVDVCCLPLTTSNTIAVTQAGTFTAYIISGLTGSATSGTATVSSGGTLGGGKSNSITITGTGNFSISLVGNRILSNQISGEETGYITDITNNTFKINIPVAVASSTQNPIELARGSTPNTSDGYRASELSSNGTPNALNLTYDATPVVGDGYCVVGKDQFCGVQVNVGTAGVGTWVVTPKYWNGTTWTALSDVVDNTVGWTALGTNTITWTIPADWKPEPILNGYGYSVIFSITNFTSIDTQPKGTEILLLDAVHFSWSSRLK